MAVEPSGLQQNVPLSPLTTIGLGGTAAFFLPCLDANDYLAGLRWAQSKELPVAILAGGSNTLVSDDGFNGLILHPKAADSNVVEESSEHVLIDVDAGCDWHEFVMHCSRSGYAGIECLAGIPGSVGATPVQNVGAYGQEVAETISQVEVLDRSDETVKVIRNEDCQFQYRQSRFKGVDRQRFIVLKVRFKLAVGGAPTFKYRELATQAAERKILDIKDPAAALLATSELVVEIRKSKSMVIDSEDPNSRSLGSFFMNPVVDQAHFDRILPKLEQAAAGNKFPKFSAPEGIKLSAAWLVERAGFRKGHMHGQVGLSGNHCLALINRQGKTAEILELALAIQKAVREQFDVELHREPVFLRPIYSM